MSLMTELQLANATKNQSGVASDPVELMPVGDQGTMALAAWHSHGVSTKTGNHFDSFTIGRLAFNRQYQAWGVAGYGFGAAVNIPWPLRDAFLLCMVKLAQQYGVITGFTTAGGAKVKAAKPKPVTLHAAAAAAAEVPKAPAKRKAHKAKA